MLVSPLNTHQVEAKSVDHIKKVNKGLENKIIELQQRLDVKAKEATAARHVEEEMVKMKEVIDRLKGSEAEAKQSG